MSAQHTPGPWKAIKGISETDGMRCGVTAVRGKVEYLVATIENGAPGDFCETEEANAALIVRACNLVMAGKALTNAHSAKIEARGDIPADPDWGLSENEIAAARMMNALMAERDELQAALAKIAALQDDKIQEAPPELVFALLDVKVNIARAAIAKATGAANV